MTAQLATVDESILAGVGRAVSVQNPNILPRSASDKPQVTGMHFDCGYLSPYFVTDFERMEVLLENAYILIHEKKLSSKKDLLPLLDQITKRGKALLIIAEDIEGEALATLVVGKLRGSLQVCAVRTPGLGNHRKAILHSIAILMGGRVITEDLDVNLKNMQISDLGWAEKITIGKRNTLVEGGAEYQQVSFQSKIDPSSAYTSPVHSSLTQIRGAPYGTPLLCPFGLR